MKMKVVLGLAICCLVSALAGSVITGNVNAQYQLEPSMITSLIQFAEDPLRKHALQAKSLCAYGNSSILMETVPSDQRFIVTQILFPSNMITTVYLDDSANNAPPYKAVTKVSGDPITLTPGVAFGPGEEIWIHIDPPQTNYVTAVGYYVDT